MNPGRAQSGDDDLKEPKRKKIRPRTILKDPYPIIFWNKLGIPPCNDLWPTYFGVFDGASVIIEYPEDMSDIYSMGCFGKRILYRRGYEPNAGDIPVLRERQWKRRVDWAADFGYILIPAEENAQGTSPTSDSQQDESPDAASAGVKMEVTECESQISVPDQTHATLGNSGDVKVPKVCDQANAKDRDDIESKETKQNKSEARNAEGHERESCEKGFNGSGKDSCLSDEVGVQGSGSETVKPECEVDKDVSIVEDRTQSESVGDGEKCVENGEGENGGIKVSMSESCSRTGENVEKAKNGIAGETEVSEASAEDVEINDVEIDSSKCNQGEDSESNCEKVEADCSGEGPKDVKEPNESKKEELAACETHSVQITEEGEVAKDAVVEKMEAGKEERVRETVNIDKGKSVREEREDESEDSEGKRNTSKSFTLNESHSEDIFKGRKKEERKCKEEFGTVEMKGSNSENPKLDSGETGSNPRTDDDAKVEIGKEGDSGITANEKQVERVLRTSSNVQNDGKVKITETEKIDGVDGESKLGCEKDNIPDLNNSGKSVEIIEGRTMKDPASPEIFRSEDDKITETAKKRSLDDLICVLEDELDENGGTEKEMETKMDERGNGEKRMKMSEVVIVEVKDVEKSDCDNVKSTDKERASSDKNGAESKVVLNKGLRETESRKNSEGRRPSVGNIDLNESIDCEIVEVEDDRTSEHGRVSSVKSSSKRKLVEENIGLSDSDDDIMEVSVEEAEEVTEIKNRKKLGFIGRNGKMEAAKQNKDAEKTSKCQLLLNEIRKKLPRDIEIMELGTRNMTAKSDRSRTSNLTEENKEVMEENEDDDVIEIDLQKSDFLELEDSGEDNSMEWEHSSHSATFQRRMKRESSSFKRMERGSVQVCEVKSEEVEEMEDKQSLASHVKLESDCGASACIVVPDSDTEDENSEVQGLPRLESDPSVYLPSLDVLHLLPEEAFFLAYGLGCLQVWDRRSMGTEASESGDNSGGLVPSDESLGVGDSSRPIKTEESEFREDVNKVVTVKQEDDEKQPKLRECDTESAEESNVGNSSSPLQFKKAPMTTTADSSDNSLLESIPIKCETGKKSDSAGYESEPVSDQSKDSQKKSVDKILDERTSDALPSASESSKDSLATPLSHKHTKSRSPRSDSCRESSKENILIDGAKEEESSGSSNQTPAGDKQVGKPSSECSAFSEVNTSNESDLNELSSKGKTSQGKDTFMDRDSDDKNNSNIKSNSVRENGELLETPITVIDLSDSPPSRQWANRDGWSDSDDENDVVAMECRNPKVPSKDSQPPANEMFNSARENLNCFDDEPMSLLELWNAFRSSRSAASPVGTPFETSYAVYHHFRTKRWVVKPGIRFGGDFLLYKDGPSFYHASYLVIIDSSGYEEKSRLSWSTLAGMNRLAENVAKDLMICRVEWPQSITEEELKSPKCLVGLTVEEIIVRRWVSIKEREEEEFQDGKDIGFIPLEL